jgi:hypothetical protein
MLDQLIDNCSIAELAAALRKAFGHMPAQGARLSTPRTEDRTTSRGHPGFEWNDRLCQRADELFEQGLGPDTAAKQAAAEINAEKRRWDENSAIKTYKRYRNALRDETIIDVCHDILIGEFEAAAETLLAAPAYVRRDVWTRLVGLVQTGQNNFAPV